jgi:hypothetical protein
MQNVIKAGEISYEKIIINTQNITIMLHSQNFF